MSTKKNIKKYRNFKNKLVALKEKLDNEVCRLQEVKNKIKMLNEDMNRFHLNDEEIFDGVNIQNGVYEQNQIMNGYKNKVYKYSNNIIKFSIKIAILYEKLKRNILARNSYLVAEEMFYSLYDSETPPDPLELEEWGVVEAQVLRLNKEYKKALSALDLDNLNEQYNYINERLTTALLILEKTSGEDAIKFIEKYIKKYNNLFFHKSLFWDLTIASKYYNIKNRKFDFKNYLTLLSCRNLRTANNLLKNDSAKPIVGNIKKLYLSF